MVGKLNIGQGEDYAFDIRAARAVAEAGDAAPVQEPEVLGPFTTEGQVYYIRTIEWGVGFDIDGQPPADVFVPPEALDDAHLYTTQRAAIRRKLRENGWPG
jgi:hypothetical protein